MHHVHPNVYATDISEPSGPVNIIQNRSPEPTKYQHRMEPAVGPYLGPFVLTLARWDPCCLCFLMPIIIFTQYHVGEIPRGKRHWFWTHKICLKYPRRPVFNVESGHADFEMEMKQS